jgi:superfamily II DNA/RNA helicase
MLFVFIIINILLNILCTVAVDFLHRVGRTATAGQSGILLNNLCTVAKMCRKY